MSPKDSLKRVLILGSGPIVIGQACEFDYSGTQACKALMQRGFEVILVNSNPATIMTDPEIATRVYVEPLKLPFLVRILEREKPDAIIPTLGGQTALNLALELAKDGVLDRLGIRMLGANPEVIRRAEDREQFRLLLETIGARAARSEMVTTFEQGLAVVDRLGLPLVLRPNYTLGGGGGGVAFSFEEYKQKLAMALHESPTSEVLVEESILGWKEFELEVMRDRTGTFVVICSIENFDACGVHTGDSITVAPQMTLSDREYQAMRDEARRIIEAVGVETGGANIQFAVNPRTGERVVIEMNPRVSRSSALASKATGFPIAKCAALLAVGFTLDEIRNDITGTTPSCYEPALDYVVTKIPRFSFEKFPGAADSLTTQMKSVGEVMGIGRTFKESMMKALAALEQDPQAVPDVSLQPDRITYPNSHRVSHVFQAFRDGHTVEQVAEWSQITPWFLEQIQGIVAVESEVRARGLAERTLLLEAKRCGLTDARLAHLSGRTPREVREIRRDYGLRPGFFRVDTCAGEFASSTPYFYSTYWTEARAPLPGPAPVIVLGSGPNRIGQGIEFDYSCVRAVQYLRTLGEKAVMINSNPETVSTDYDTADQLFFEPLTAEHVAEVAHLLKPKGMFLQLGGQTPISLADELVAEGFALLGSSLDAVDLAEDRGRFAQVCQELEFRIPEAAMVADVNEARRAADRIGYPVLCRPSYVLGGRRMEIVENREELEDYFVRYGYLFSAKNPCLIDQFLDRALEVDVDLVRGEDWTLIGGIVEHLEAAGVHSGDSMGVLPPQRLKPSTARRIEDMSRRLAERLGIIGFLNLQLAIKDDTVFILEANPRSSRSLPFVCKATGIPLVDLGVRAVLGHRSATVRPERFDWSRTQTVSVKGVVFPFKKFAEADSILGPEMKSTGESMGRGQDYAEALMKALLGSNMKLPLRGEVFLSWREKDKAELLDVARQLQLMGYTLSATEGTAKYLTEQGLRVTLIRKVHEGRPHCVDRIRSRQVDFVINTTSGRRSIEASLGIRRGCVDYGIPCITESDAAKAVLIALQRAREDRFDIEPLPKAFPI